MTDDRDIDAILTRASKVSPPPGALDRLMARVEAPATVVPFRRPAPRSQRSFWPAAALLAASLAAGLYLGAAGYTEAIYPGDTGVEDVADLTGLTDAEDALDEESAS